MLNYQSVNENMMGKYGITPTNNNYKATKRYHNWRNRRPQRKEQEPTTGDKPDQRKFEKQQQDVHHKTSNGLVVSTHP